jgi:hypothetical protein
VAAHGEMGAFSKRLTAVQGLALSIVQLRGMVALSRSRHIDACKNYDTSHFSGIGCRYSFQNSVAWMLAIDQAPSYGRLSKRRHSGFSLGPSATAPVAVKTLHFFQDSAMRATSALRYLP